MDIFENQYVDMESISKAKDEVEESNKSPFKSPKKRMNGSMSPQRIYNQSSMHSKDDLRRVRREEKKSILDEFERKDREPPKQYQLLQIKTAVTRYPTINYIQPFTNEEIMEGKKCLLNHMKRSEAAEVTRKNLIEMSTTKKRHRSNSKQGRFALNIEKATIPTTPEKQERAITPNRDADPAGSDDADKEKTEVLNPKKRAPGGVWIQAADFPHSFEHMIVYHNMNRFQHNEIYNDVWTEAATPFLSNEKDVYLKLELDEETFDKYKEDNNLPAETTLADIVKSQEEEDVQHADGLPGEVKLKTWSPD